MSKVLRNIKDKYFPFGLGVKLRAFALKMGINLRPSFNKTQMEIMMFQDSAYTMRIMVLYNGLGYFKDSELNDNIAVVALIKVIANRCVDLDYIRSVEDPTLITAEEREILNPYFLTYTPMLSLLRLEAGGNAISTKSLEIAKLIDTEIEETRSLALVEKRVAVWEKEGR